MSDTVADRNRSGSPVMQGSTRSDPVDSVGLPPEILEAVVKSTGLIAVHAVDVEGAIRFWNEGCARFFGFSAAEAIGRRVQDLILEGSAVREYERQLAAICMTGEAPDPQEWPVVTRDGEKLWLLSTMLPALSGGSVNYVFCIDVNITESKKARESLAASEERFHHIADTVSDWIWEVDRNGAYTYCSENIRQILGYEAEEIIGKTPFDFMEESERERVGGVFIDLVRNKKEIRDLINWNVARDGRKVCLQTNGVALLDDDGNLIGYRGADRDVTSRMVAEEKLREKVTELESFTRLAVNRELRMVELKERIKDLEGQLEERNRPAT